MIPALIQIANIFANGLLNVNIYKNTAYAD